MAIPGAGLGIVWFEYSGNGVVVAGRVKFMAVLVPGLGISRLGIPGLAKIWGVPFEYSGSGAAAGGRRRRQGHGNSWYWTLLVLVHVVGGGEEEKRRS